VQATLEEASVFRELTGMVEALEPAGELVDLFAAGGDGSEHDVGDGVVVPRLRRTVGRDRAPDQGEEREESDAALAFERGMRTRSHSAALGVVNGEQLDVAMWPGMGEGSE